MTHIEPFIFVLHLMLPMPVQSLYVLLSPWLIGVIGTHRTYPICVALPKVANASAVIVCIVLALATLGDATHIEPILFVLHNPR
jgi:hypothetical protein